MEHTISILVFAAAIGAINYVVAERKHRSGILWAAFGVLFGIFALLVLLFMGDASAEQKNQ